MSGRDDILKVNDSLDLPAPKFRDAVIAALAECKTAGLDAKVYEAYRSQELQALYYARGRTMIPPPKPVTNAPTNLQSWHGFGLAVDVIDRTLFWKPIGGEAWFAKVAVIFKRYDCSWGGDWKNYPDTPHFQWHLCKPSPSDEARALNAREGLPAVWAAVGAA
jgi:D-alanyl-D-alanine carboxypeptidase